MRTKFCSVALAAALAIGASVPAANAAALDGVLNQMFGTETNGCNSQVRLKLTEAIKKGIETEVRRREDLMKNPIALQGLTCLDNLMNVNLDFAITVPNIGGLFQGAVSNATDRLCQMAQDKLSEITGPLQQALNIDPFQALDIPGMSGGGGSQTIEFGTLSMGTGQGGPSVTFQPRDAGEGSFSRSTINDLYGD